jgi:hypothetical protein
VNTEQKRMRNKKKDHENINTKGMRESDNIRTDE